MSTFDLALPDSVPDDCYRRRAGLLLGALLGLVYALFAEVGERLLLPGVPLYQPPLGVAGNTLMFTLAGALLGVSVAWPDSGIKGVFLMAAVSAAGIVLLSLAAASGMGEGIWIRLIAAISLALPFWGMLVPIYAALRWVISHQEEAHRDGQSWRGRLLGPIVLVAIMALAGYSTIYPLRGRETLQVADAMLAAARRGPAPELLGQVAGFPAHAAAPYRLAWEASNIDRFRIPRPGRNFDRHSAVIARYPDGWSLVCVYIAAGEPPLCRGFDALP